MEAGIGVDGDMTQDQVAAMNEALEAHAAAHGHPYDREAQRLSMRTGKAPSWQHAPADAHGSLGTTATDDGSTPGRDAAIPLPVWWVLQTHLDADAGDLTSSDAGLVFNIVSDKIAPAILTSSVGGHYSILAVYVTVSGWMGQRNSCDSHCAG